MSSSLSLLELMKEKEEIVNNIKRLNLHKNRLLAKEPINLINYKYEIDNEHIKLNMINQIIIIIEIKNELKKRLHK
jgi:hypothetical protein